MLHGNGYYGYHATAKRFDKVAALLPPPPPEYIENSEWELVTDNPSAAKVKYGVTVLNFRGEAAEITGGSPPTKPSSTGFVVNNFGDRVYPQVYNLRWQKKEPK